MIRRRQVPDGHGPDREGTVCLCRPKPPVLEHPGVHRCFPCHHINSSTPRRCFKAILLRRPVHCRWIRRLLHLHPLGHRCGAGRWDDATVVRS
eukprot:symbB.v1.2.039496.t1/scaffold6604.1/size16761/2